MVPLIRTDDKRVRPALLEQVIPLVLASDQAFINHERPVYQL